jgi:hypothetical protein
MLSGLTYIAVVALDSDDRVCEDNPTMAVTATPTRLKCAAASGLVRLPARSRHSSPPFVRFFHEY